VHKSSAGRQDRLRGTVDGLNASHAAYAVLAGTVRHRPQVPIERLHVFIQDFHGKRRHREHTVNYLALNRSTLVDVIGWSCSMILICARSAADVAGFCPLKEQSAHRIIAAAVACADAGAQAR
jgi:hypothetical protein